MRTVQTSNARMGFRAGLPLKILSVALAFGLGTNLASARQVTGTVQFSGQASAINFVNLHTGPATVVIASTGQLGIGGGTLDASVSATNMEGLSLEMANASTIGAANETVSSSSLQNLSLTLMTISGALHTLTASLVMAEASASCTSSGAVFTGSSQIQGLAIDGVAINVTGEANQTLVFDEFTLVLNEQIEASTKGGGTISVAGIHVLVHDCLHGFIALARAGIRCQGHAPKITECTDWLTGGGWIVGTPSGDKGNFGVGGGIRKGAFWGHLNYIDHGTGMHVKSHTVTGYEVVDANTRIIHYNCTIDGQSGTAVVRVADNGEPGRDDTFEIMLSNGYAASGSLGGDGSGGGNIQLHKPKCEQHGKPN
jgi:hypothetical protein